MGNNLKEDVLDKLKMGVSTSGVYAVCISDYASWMFEILSTRELLREHNEKRNYGVIALIEGRNEAKAYVAHVIDKWLKHNEDLTGIKEYYNNNSL